MKHESTELEIKHCALFWLQRFKFPDSLQSLTALPDPLFRNVIWLVLTYLTGHNHIANVKRLSFQTTSH